MGERIKELRKRLNLTQEEFGERIQVKRSTIATYEVGRNEPIDGVIKLICIVYNVNEDWLRNGNGKMFKEMSVPEEVTRFVGQRISDKDSEYSKAVIDLLLAIKSLDQDEFLQWYKVCKVFFNKNEIR
mgnify:CR=1 FL=1